MYTFALFLDDRRILEGEVSSWRFDSSCRGESKMSFEAIGWKETRRLGVVRRTGAAQIKDPVVVPSVNSWCPWEK